MRIKTQKERDVRKAQRKAKKKEQKSTMRTHRVLISMMNHIATINDPRRAYGNLRHKLADILVIALCTLLAGFSTFVDMEDFGHRRLKWLREEVGLELPNGIPDADTIRRLLESVKPEEVTKALRGWLREQFGVPNKDRQVTAIDGKTIRGSKSDEKRARHVLSAFVAEHEVTLGEIVVDEKTNEITAMPELLKMIDVAGNIVTADAMNCQRETVAEIIRQQGDYVIGLKENQPTLFEDTRLYFETPGLGGWAEKRVSDKDHGRIETRTARLLTDIDWLEQKKDWAGLKGLGCVTAVVTTIGTGEVREYTRYFITSLTDIDEFADAVRKHWRVENNLHWNLDVILREDSCRARKDNSPVNLNLMRKWVLELIHHAQSKQAKRISKRRIVNNAAMSEDYMLKILMSSGSMEGDA